MKKVFLIFGVVVFLMIVGLSGCVQEGIEVDTDEMLRFVGIWEASENDVFIFAANGACRYITTKGSYRIEDGQLVVFLENGIDRTYDYIFSNDDATLTLTNIDIGDTTVYTKQPTEP